MQTYHFDIVLIPLLLDDPLWVMANVVMNFNFSVLIPLLLDDPLWAALIYAVHNFVDTVLIPLLLDDPLWALLKMP